MTADAPAAGSPPSRIEDYAIIGDCRTGALVGRNGSIDWLCWPRFDSGACLAALLGTSRNGRWLLAPADGTPAFCRSYVGDTNVLETVFETSRGCVAIIDFMPVGNPSSSVVRRVEGRRGQTAMAMELILRFDYGKATPWVAKTADGISAVVGPNLVVLRTSVPLQERDRCAVARFSVKAGETIDFVLCWGSSHEPAPAQFGIDEALGRTLGYWERWSSRCTYLGEWRPQVLRSLLALKALTYADTGGIVAALTTSLPEQLGGARNWDYRYCWLRDATLTLLAFMGCGYDEEAKAWGAWLHRAVAGRPNEAQIMYGVAGERLLVEWSPPWLPGYQGAAPVRIGNAASEQVQLDVFGEMAGTQRLGRVRGLAEPDIAWPMQKLFIEHLIEIWGEPDDGIWEVRGGRRHFTHSKVMTWVAMDCSIRDAEQFGMDAPLGRWREVRDRIHAEVCEKGFDQERNTFTQSYGSAELDASLLLLPQVGFLPAEDPRVQGTVAAIERELIADGLVRRYRTEGAVDGLVGDEGAFLPCSFWLVDAYSLLGRRDEARALFGRLLSLSNDVGLLSEEYDARACRQVGNFPQAFSHVSLIGSALTMDGRGLSRQRAANSPRASQ